MASLRTPAKSLLLRGPALRPAAARATRLPAPLLSSTRKYHPSRPLAAYKDDQDRESLKPRPSSEQSGSGSPYDVAEKKKASFGRETTDPAGEKDQAARESNGNPLEMSGANHEFSKSSKPGEEAERSEKKKSAGSGGKKHGKVAPM